MELVAHNPPAVPAPTGGYHNALEVADPGRLLFISGQIPVSSAGNVPDSAEGQCRQIWASLRV